MRRLLIAIALAVTVVGAALLLGSGPAPYRVAAIFDTANGLVGGEQVKIAGVPVGTIDQVQLAGGRGPIKAKVMMNVKSGMSPFYRDATCTILPEGLISENYVECNPGSARSGHLPTGTGGTPIVPLSQTTVPASLQDLLNVFSLPVDDRARVVIDELGIATAGRGDDLNALLRRSNPALDEADRLLAILDAQRRQLTSGISQTGQVLAALARQNPSVTAFVDHTAAVSTTSAEHSAALGSSIGRLPGLLSALRPGLRALNRTLVNGTPLLVSLRSAAPELVGTTYALPQFAAAGIPALASLGPAASAGLAALPAAEPVVRDLRRASEPAVPFAENLDKLLISTRDNGGFEGLLTFFYAFATLTAGYDQTSHVMALILRVFPQCLSGTGAAGCSFKFNAPGQGTIPPDDPACGPQDGATWDPPTTCKSILALNRPRGDLPSASRTPRRSRASNPAPQGSPSTVAPTAPAVGAAAPAHPVTLPPVVSGLLGAVTGTLKHLGATGPTGAPAAPNPLRSLLSYLLGR